MNRKNLLLVSGLILALAASQSTRAQQFAYPNGTLSGDANYTPTGAASNWQAVGEGVGWDDANYIETTINPGIIEFSLTDTIVDPGVDTGHIIRFRSINTSNNNKDVTLTLRDNGAQVAQGAVGVPKKTNAWTEFTFPISTAAIGNYANLSIEISGNGTGPAPVMISWVVLETPDATITPAEVATLPADNVIDDSARLWGQVTTDGSPGVSTCGVDWGTSPTGPYDAGSQSVACSGTAPFSFSVNVDNVLTPGTDYWYIAWADNGVRADAPTNQPFTTLPPVEVPTVTVSPTVLSITTDSAFLSGNVTSDGNGTVTDCGIVWDTVQHPELSPTNTFKSLGSGTGACEGTVDGLPAGDEIFYEAYATNSAGTGYSNSDFSFLTLAGPATVTTDVPASVNATTAVLGGDVTNNGGATVTDRGIVWSTTPLPQVGVDTTVQMGSGTGSFSDTVGNLVPASDVALPTGQLVYFRAYAINSEGTAYGNQRSFTPLGPPELTALPADNVTLYSGTTHGRLDNDGGNNLTDCGIAWGNTSGGPYPNLESVGLCTAGVPFDVILSTLPGTTVYYKAYATNDLAQTTLSVEPAVTSGQESFTTPSEPTEQASNVTFPRESGAAMRISWTRGNGTGVIVVMRLATEGRTDPQDGNDYLPSQDFSACPAELPTNSGNCVVYKGTAGGVLVTGLAANTNYAVVVYEYTGTGASTDYLLVDAPSASNTGSHSTTDEPVHNMDYGINCDQCHKHGNFNLIGDAALITVCQNCHADGGDASTRREFSNHVLPKDADNGPHPDVTFVACGTCHELHNPESDNTTLSYNPLTDQTTYNKSFLRSNVGKYIPGAVDGAFLHNDQPLRAAGNDSGYPETPFDTPERAVEGGTDAVDPISATQARGYCQVCHTLTDYHRSSNTAGSDQCHDGQTGNCGPTEAHCGECHEHNDSFKGKGGTTTCMVCHADVTNLGSNTRREVMTEFDHPRPGTQTPGDPDESSHIYAGSSAILEPDCLVCHAFDESHQQQKVVLYDLDDPDGATTRTFYSQTSDEVSAQIPAQGAPLSQHCLSCHEDGTPTFLPASGTDQTESSPFIGSNSAPIMSDAGLWTGASHNDSAAIGCVGCHVGHGSSQHSLLDPDPPAFPAGANPSNFDTDFCINCHDNDGPSAKDIAAQFDTGTDYRVTGMNGELNNQRHDVTYDDQVNYSSSALACNDCHSPHIDNDTDPVRHPDTGAVLPTFAITGSWNGGSYDSGGNSDPSNPEGGGSVTEPDYIQFCLACHDGTPAGNSAGAYDIGSSYVTSRGGKRHGNGDGSTGTGIGKGNLKPPWTTAADYAANQDPVNVYAALNCTTCHGPHGTGNIYSLRESITVAGTPMEIGSDAPAGQFPKPTFSGFTYTLPVDATSGSQTRDIYGAWCTFCHNMNSGHTGVTEQSNCNSGHRHGGNNF